LHRFVGPGGLQLLWSSYPAAEEPGRSPIPPSLSAKEGDFLLFYEDDSGKIVVKMEKG
jgi:hypothetical protein